MKDILQRDISAHAHALSHGEYSAKELTRAYLARIAECDGEIGAFLSTDPEGALRAAEASDARRHRGECKGPLDGIPFSLKDNISAEGLPLTCASKMLEHYVAPYDATVTASLKQAGAILLGKNNMDEFAMGSSTEYSALGVTRNPADLTRSPGGSSGGSAAAVAAAEAVFSIGTDTGGSVRQPAAFCGVYGLKPTYGGISRYGVAAMAASLDCVGIMTRTAADCATVFSAIAGKDPSDATTRPFCKERFATRLQEPPGHLRVAIVASITEEKTEPAVWEALQAAICRFRNAGSEVETVKLPLPEEALATYSILSCTEAASNLARYDGVHFGRRSERFDSLSSFYDTSRAEGFGNEVKRRILFGTDMLSEGNRASYYVRACRVRELVKQEMTALSHDYDLLLTPTTPTVAFPIGSRPSPEALYYADLCTVYANLSGFPALSIPCGNTPDGLPLAFQLTARPFEEDLLLRAARLFEEVMA